LIRAVEEGGLAGVEVGGEEDRRFEGDGEDDGARRWRRRSVASEGVRTGRVDQDVAVEREVVERAGEEAVKVAHDLISGVDVDGEIAEGLSVGCSALVVSVLSSLSSSTLCMAPAVACSWSSFGKRLSTTVFPVVFCTSC
jgi:hypothetical protein